MGGVIVWANTAKRHLGSRPPYPVTRGRRAVIVLLYLPESRQSKVINELGKSLPGIHLSAGTLAMAAIWVTDTVGRPGRTCPNDLSSESFLAVVVRRARESGILASPFRLRSSSFRSHRHAHNPAAPKLKR